MKYLKAIMFTSAGKFCAYIAGLYILGMVANLIMRLIFGAWVYAVSGLLAIALNISIGAFFLLFILMIARPLRKFILEFKENLKK